MDENLQVVEDNRPELERVLRDFQPQVFCTSRFVEKAEVYRRKLPAVGLQNG